MDSEGVQIPTRYLHNTNPNFHNCHESRDAPGAEAAQLGSMSVSLPWPLRTAVLGSLERKHKSLGLFYLISYLCIICSVSEIPLLASDTHQTG